METITTITTFTKDGKSKVVFNNKYFLSLEYVKKLTGIQSNHHILVGSSIDATYYKKDEAMTDGTVCTKDEVIIKSAIIELSPRLQQFQLMAAFGVNIAA